MEDEGRRGKGGRPPTGRLFPYKVFGYLGAEELRLLNRLAERRNGSGKPLGVAGAIRKAIRLLAEREGVE
jgi:hypothetical protein